MHSEMPIIPAGADGADQISAMAGRVSYEASKNLLLRDHGRVSSARPPLKTNYDDMPLVDCGATLWYHILYIIVMSSHG